jgi:hypothetical protein
MVATFWVIFTKLTVSFFVWFSMQSGIGVHSCRFVAKPHGPVRLHIEALLLDLFYGVQGQFFKTNHEWRRIDTKVSKKAEPEPRITRMAPMFVKPPNARMLNAE